MKIYQVIAVDDADLPADHDWAIVDLPDRTLFIVKRSADWQASAEGWAAYRIVAEGRRCSPTPLCAAV